MRRDKLKSRNNRKELGKIQKRVRQMHLKQRILMDLCNNDDSWQTRARNKATIKSTRIKYVQPGDRIMR